VGTGVFAMTQGDPQEPLKSLERRIEEARRAARRPGERRDGETETPFATMLAFAWRIGLELVVAIVVGTGLGWAIDRGLGTRPWGMIVFFFLGVAAGLLNVWRAVTGMGKAVGFRKDEGKDGT
jgi:ATP synthase protein I